MAERNTRRQRRDSVGIWFALLFFSIAAIGLTGGTWWLISGNWAWVAAAVAGLLGVAILTSSLPRRRGD